MKRKRVNLLVKQSRYQSIERVFGWLRSAPLILAGVALVMSLVVFQIVFSQKHQYEILLSKKQSMLSYLLQNKDNEAKFVYFNNKEQQVSGIIANDVNFLPYYRLLANSLQSASPAAQLESVTISKNRSVDFVLKFNSYDNMIDFIAFFESDAFLKNFSQLQLSGFNSSSAKQGTFQMNFVGKFIPLS